MDITQKSSFLNVQAIFGSKATRNTNRSHFTNFWNFFDNHINLFTWLPFLSLNFQPNTASFTDNDKKGDVGFSWYIYNYDEGGFFYAQVGSLFSLNRLSWGQQWHHLLSKHILWNKSLKGCFNSWFVTLPLKNENKFSFLIFGVMIYNGFEILNIWKIHLKPYLFHEQLTINMIFYFQRVVNLLNWIELI